ncbi:hypothetical protein [Alkalicoccobacillus gibsonii]|uniref:hypothetical protein n=1 Tax=Alkalicoccobacillus gibsonii TaxID=79881 RepID=UPI003511FB8F
MKINYSGSISVDEFAQILTMNMKEFIEHGEQDPQTILLHNPIVQLAFKLDPESDPVVMTTENDELFQVNVDLAQEQVKHNEFDKTEDQRLWSKEMLQDLEPTQVPTKTIDSDYRPKQLEYVTEHEVKENLIQEVFNIIGTDNQLIRYINTDISGLKINGGVSEGIVAEEVVEAKGEE